MDGLLRDQELNLLLQGCLCFYFTLIPQEGRGRGGAEPEPSVRLAQGGSAGSHPALQAQFSKALKLVLIIKFLLKRCTALEPLLVQ